MGTASYGLGELLYTSISKMTSVCNGDFKKDILIKDDRHHIKVVNMMLETSRRILPEI